MTVSQVGPRLALAITAAHPVTKLQLAIVTDDVDVYTSVSGVGRKTAQRIILELKEKVHAAGIAGGPSVDRLRRRGGARVARLLGRRGAEGGGRGRRHRRRARHAHQGGPPGARPQPMMSPVDRWSDPKVAEQILRSYPRLGGRRLLVAPVARIVRRLTLPAEPGLRRRAGQPERGARPRQAGLPGPPVGPGRPARADRGGRPLPPFRPACCRTSRRRSRSAPRRSGCSSTSGTRTPRSWRRTPACWW